MPILVFCTALTDGAGVRTHPSCLDTDHHSVPLQPIVTTEFCTGSDGYFSGVLAVTWDDIRTHPDGSLIAFDESCLEHELEVHAHILEPKESHTTSPPRAACIPITQSTVRLISDIDDTVKLSRVLDGARAVSSANHPSPLQSCTELHRVTDSIERYLLLQ